MRAAEGTSEWVVVTTTGVQLRTVNSKHPRGYDVTLLADEGLASTLALLGVERTPFGTVELRISHGFPPLVEVKTSRGMVPVDQGVSDLVMRWYVQAMQRQRAQS